ncbi:hypothetical protein CC80DRAFT_588386 [Byssothecium circinans]|uniref:Uncharacterized protein n=1 Tax=Byssothecium circinans TaxID=147558 RepID=A0A6A5UGJ9_9PLEO|nr:hypothetical protein CC80DRAFT_588386 [Byssothecium circinans]
MGIDLLNQWHIQCVRPQLDTAQDETDYINSVDIFVRRIWVKRGTPASQNATGCSKLRVANVENSQMTYRGATTDTVKIRFTLETDRPTQNTMEKSIRHFCDRIFELAAEGDISAKMGLITENSLLGVEPLSRLFRLYWTQGFLSLFVRREAPLFHAVASAKVLTPWLRGIIVAVYAATENAANAKLIQHIWAIVPKIIPESRTPPPEKLAESEQKMKDFRLKAEELVRYMEVTSERCDIEREGGGDRLPADRDVELVDHLLDTLSLSFDVLTLNKTIYKEWMEIVGSAGTSMKAAATLTGAAGVATSICILKGSSAVLGPAALTIVCAVLFVLHRQHHNEVKREAEELKKVSEEICGVYVHIQSFAQWLVVSSKGPPTASEGTEMTELRQRLHSQGLDPSFSLNDFQATIDSEATAIKDKLWEMEQDPACKNMFSP